MVFFQTSIKYHPSSCYLYFILMVLLHVGYHTENDKPCVFCRIIEQPRLEWTSKSYLLQPFVEKGAQMRLPSTLSSCTLKASSAGDTTTVLESCKQYDGSHCKIFLSCIQAVFGSFKVWFDVTHIPVQLHLLQKAAAVLLCVARDFLPFFFLELDLVVLLEYFSELTLPASGQLLDLSQEKRWEHSTDNQGLIQMI